MKLIFRRTMSCIALATFMLSASGEGPAYAQSNAQMLPGFGKDTRRPQGKPLQIPAGLEIAGPIVGADDDGNCPGAQTEPVGSGLWVRTCLPVKNRGGGPILFHFPKGLVVVSRAEGFQHGILVEEETIPVPPTTFGTGGKRDEEEKDKNKRDVVYIPLHLYCLNEGKEPSVPNARYELGPVTSHAGLAELYELMKNKNISNDGEKVEILQKIMWDVIKRGRMTNEDRNNIRSF